MTRWSRLVPYLQVAPLTVVLLGFLGVPLAVVVAVSFFSDRTLFSRQVKIADRVVARWSIEDVHLLQAERGPVDKGSSKSPASREPANPHGRHH